MNKYNNLKVLFVDTNEAIRKMYVKLLEPFFSTVYEAKDSESAFQVYKEKKPDILIVDIHLPTLNGIEFLSIIRENDHGTRAIMFISDLNDNFLLKASELKLTKYLVKSIEIDEFLKAVSKAINEIESFDIIPREIVVLKDNHVWDLNKKEI